jgi:hypothetical protein
MHHADPHSEQTLSNTSRAPVSGSQTAKKFLAILVGTGLIELSVLSSLIAARVGTPSLLVQAIAAHTTAADRDDDAAPLALDEKGAARGLAAIPAVAQGAKNKAGNPVSRIQVSVVAGRECEMADLVRSQLADAEAGAPTRRVDRQALEDVLRGGDGDARRRLIVSRVKR